MTKKHPSLDHLAFSGLTVGCTLPDVLSPLPSGILNPMAPLPPPPTKQPFEPVPLELELPLPPLPSSGSSLPAGEEPRFIVVDLGETGDWIQL